MSDKCDRDMFNAYLKFNESAPVILEDVDDPDFKRQPDIGQISNVPAIELKLDHRWYQDDKWRPFLNDRGIQIYMAASSVSGPLYKRNFITKQVETIDNYMHDYFKGDMPNLKAWDQYLYLPSKEVKGYIFSARADGPIHKLLGDGDPRAPKGHLSAYPAWNFIWPVAIMAIEKSIGAPPEKGSKEHKVWETKVKGFLDMYPSPGTWRRAIVN